MKLREVGGFQLTSQLNCCYAGLMFVFGLQSLQPKGTCPQASIATFVVSVGHTLMHYCAIRGIELKRVVDQDRAIGIPSSKAFGIFRSRFQQPLTREFPPSTSPSEAILVIALPAVYGAMAFKSVIRMWILFTGCRIESECGSPGSPWETKKTLGFLRLCCFCCHASQAFGLLV